MFSVYKTFDEKNYKGIGTVISKAYESIGVENLQIFMFDNQYLEILSIEASYSEDLVNQNKSEFNPFMSQINKYIFTSLVNKNDFGEVRTI